MLIFRAGKKQSIRFAVTDQDGGRLTDIWRITTNKKGDVYIGTGIMSAFKASLHAGGKCRFAYTREFWESAVAPGLVRAGDRARYKWDRPPLQPGNPQQVLIIGFPGHPYLSPPQSPERPIDISLISAGRGFATDILFAYALESHDKLTVAGWTVRARIDLGSGEHVYLMTRLTAFPVGLMEQIVPKSPAFDWIGGDLDAEASSGHLRSIMFAEPQGGCAMVMDYGGFTLTRNEEGAPV